MSLFRAVGATGGTPRSLSARALSGNNYMTFESPSGTDYQVPAGKTFKITRVVFQGAAGALLTIGYGDDGVADGAAAPTNPVGVIGNGLSFSPLVSTATNTTYAVDIYGEIPTGKYPYLRGVSYGPSTAQLIGVEE